MLLELTVPDWAAEKTQHILSCFELVAYKPVGQDWKVKTVSGRCNYCGNCCVHLGTPCQFLYDHPMGRQCRLGLARKTNCSYRCNQDAACTEVFFDQPGATGAPNIRVEIPDWANDSAIYILTDVEVVAYYRQEIGHWRVKTSRCNRCGLCCDVENCADLIVDPEGATCGRGINMPFHCAVTIENPDIPECTLAFEDRP